MPKPTSFADVILAWQKQLDAYLRHADKFTGAEPPQRLELEGLLKQAFGLKDQQQGHTGVRQKTTKDITVLVKTGNEVMRRLQSHAKSVLGTDNEILVDFGVAPRRARGSRKTKTAKKKPVTPPVTPPPAKSADGASPEQPAVKPSES